MTAVTEEPTIEFWKSAWDDQRTVHQRMLAILAELPPIGKDQRNAEQNFMFRGHDDVLNALNPLFARHGVFVVPDVLERITGERTTGKGRTMYEVNLHVRFTFWGAAGDSVTSSTWGEGTDMGDKATSKAMTMAFKSVLNQAFSISNKEASDPDGQTAEQTVRREDPRAGRVKPARGWDDWRHRMAELSIPEGDVDEWLRQACAAIGIESLANVSPEERRAVFVRANRVLVTLADEGTGFPGPSRARIGAAFSEAFDGVVVDGPSGVDESVDVVDEGIEWPA